MNYSICKATKASRLSPIGVIVCQKPRYHQGDHLYQVRITWSDDEAGPREPSRLDLDTPQNSH